MQISFIFLGHGLAQKDKNIHLHAPSNRNFFLMLTVGGKCFDHLPDLFSGPPHNFSAQMGTNTEALKFDISEPRMGIHTIKTRDRKQCMPVPLQPKCGRIPSAHNCGSRLQPTKLNQLTLFVLNNYNVGGEISQMRPTLLRTLLPSAARRWSKKEPTV
jgi:hypothetical protein